MTDTTITGKKLEAILPKERIKARQIDLVSYASDAGFYYLRPQAVVQPVSEEEIRALFNFSAQQRIPLTFRAAGTSLSGQSITDGILVDLSLYWPNIKVEEGGSSVRVQPGITGAKVNGVLKKYGRKIGPDPSSISAAMIGGILSNNSSGMCCGVKQNSYHTTAFIRFILPGGHTFSTEAKEDHDRFKKECPGIYSTIHRLRLQVMGNAELHDRIRLKYQTKNTVGYSLNAFIDYEHPLDILAHLLIGAEGTLGFIAEAVMRTVPDNPYKSTGLLFFPDIFAACQAIVPLTDIGAEAVELMDRASLRSIEHIPGIPNEISLLPDSAAALLIEFQGTTAEEVYIKLETFLRVSGNFSMLNMPAFTNDEKEQAFLWKLRKGMFPAVGAVRKAGTTVILEDIAFPVAQLGHAILDLQALFKKHQYTDAIIFGHAKDGNIHFVVTQTFNDAAAINRYGSFMNEVVELVVEKYDGTLKAEHGTGRNMAPFVETEWGAEAYRIMQELKAAVDPGNLLNPGVIINADKTAHLKNLKQLPVVEQEVDKCIECGYCEHVCPSRDLTMTPRRRIVARREMALLREAGNKRAFDSLKKQYQYDGLDTCAVDGLCAQECPVDINTGDLVKRLRAEQHGRFSNALAIQTVRYFAVLTALVRLLLSVGGFVNKLAGPSAMTRLTKGLKKIVPALPVWSRQLQRAASIKNIPAHSGGNGDAVVYFPTCISRMMGGSSTKKDAAAVFLSVAEKAGLRVIISPSVDSLCCSQLFSSKGYKIAYRDMANRSIAALWQCTGEGKWPVILDVSSCTQTLQHCRPALSPENQQRFDAMKIMDSIEFLSGYVIPRIGQVTKKSHIVLHPVCSIQKMGLEQQFTAVAKHFANEVKIPLNKGCCGMAGDRGFLFPGLVMSATRAEAAEVNEVVYDGYYSTGKTCEMALSETAGQSYESILYLADETIGHHPEHITSSIHKKSIP